jgi:hypothetical protein
MRDEYAGDIGDFGKIALLRHLATNGKLGVCWYKTTDPRKNKNDGRHIKYLSNETGFRDLEPIVFVTLKRLVESHRRSIAALEQSGLLPGAVFHDIEVPANSSRQSWAKCMMNKMADCDFVFLDPDNGMEGKQLTNKHVAISEIKALRKENRILVLYHHQSRRPAHEEANSLRTRIIEAGWSPVELIRFRPFSSRFYIIAGHDVRMSKRIEAFVAKWGEKRIAHFPIAQ